MFPSRSTRRRQRTAAARYARLGRGTSRRLGVESMEGRLMLAVSVLDFNPIELPAAAVSVAGDQVVSAPGPAVWVARLNSEGGYITNRFSINDASLDSDVTILASGLDGNTISELVSRTIRISDDIDRNGTSLSWVQLRELQLSGEGLEPVAIFVTPDAADVTGALETVFANFSGPDLDGDPSEPGGGPISIEPILASNELNRSPESEQSVAAQSLEVDDVADSDPELRLAALATESSSISGEWARAIVFELAGGEPEQLGRSRSSKHVLGTATEVDASGQVGDPLSAIDASRAARANAAERTAHVQYAGVLSDAADSSHPVADWPNGMFGQSNAPIDREVDGGVATAAASQTGPRLAQTNEQRVDALVGPDALAQAFDEFTGNTKAIIRSLADESWRESFGATPLLMVLALERIAAGNSRRNRPAAATSVVRRPKLQGSRRRLERA